MSDSQSALSRRQLLFGALGLLALPVACGGAGEEPVSTPRTHRGEPRPYLMGFSSLPADTSADGYEQAFRLASLNGEVVLIQRAPPWTDFLPGHSISDRTERLTRLEKDLARRFRLRLFLVIDATDPADRGRLASPPAAYADATFSDSDVRAALVAYARYLAFNYRPAYLAFGVEVDMFYSQRGDGAFRNFQSLYFQAYDAIKAESEDTLVFPIFQYENLRGSLLAPTPVWNLINRFEPKLDLVAVSSFPGSVFPDPASLPEDYYGELAARAQHPLAFAGLGWATTGAAGHGQADQDSYLGSVLTAADQYESSLLVWYLGQDLVAPTAGLESSATMGLYTSDGQEKIAYHTWHAAEARPPLE